MLHADLIVASQLSSGQLAAYITIDNGNRLPMVLSGAAATFGFVDFPVNTHNFTVTFEFTLNSAPDKPLIIAQINAIHDFSDGLTRLEIPYSELGLMFDADTDGNTNIHEILAGTNPYSTWTWIAGSNTPDSPGSYGVLGQANLSNTPGARELAVSWTYSNGDLWLFGGYGYGTDSATAGWLNDLWRGSWDSTTDTWNWTWIAGSSTVNSTGTYGIQGQAGQANTPGARSQAVTWIDKDGGFWLFGGLGYSVDSTVAVRLNDLWRGSWESTTGTWKWTWIAGSKTADSPGVYGVQGQADTANTPGARDDAVGWMDSNGWLWLFGGQGYDGTATRGFLNDMWRGNWDTTTATWNWTWIAGSKTTYSSDVYGVQGQADPTNTVGARHSAAAWADLNDGLWLFGGHGLGGAAMNDMWRGSWDNTTATWNWTWIAGSKAGYAPGIYGVQGLEDAANIPGARRNAVTWIDGNGGLWLFGGVNYDGLFNDLWRGHWSNANLSWTWITGSKTVNSLGVFGIQGKADPANIPGSRRGAVTWTDSNGGLWLFGGWGYGADTVGGGRLNGLWYFEP